MSAGRFEKSTRTGMLSWRTNDATGTRMELLHQAFQLEAPLCFSDPKRARLRSHAAHHACVRRWHADPQPRRLHMMLHLPDHSSRHELSNSLAEALGYHVVLAPAGPAVLHAADDAYCAGWLVI